jgi:hypothetical protein
MIHSNEKAKLVWVNRMAQGFRLVAGVSADKFQQLDKTFGLVEMLFGSYETGHEVAGSYTIEAMYNRLPDQSGLKPYSEERCIELGVN